MDIIIGMYLQYVLDITMENTLSEILTENFYGKVNIPTLTSDE